MKKANQVMKTVLMVIPAIALASAVSTSAMADKRGDREHACQDGNYGKKGKHSNHGKYGKPMGERMQKKLAKKLDLTDAQTQSLSAIFAANSVDRQSSREAACLMFDKLATLEPGTAEYNAQIDAMATARATNMAAGMKAWGQTQADIMAILNEEQQAEFKEMIEHMKKRWH